MTLFKHLPSRLGIWPLPFCIMVRHPESDPRVGMLRRERRKAVHAGTAPQKFRGFVRPVGRSIASSIVSVSSSSKSAKEFYEFDGRLQQTLVMKRAVCPNPRTSCARSSKDAVAALFSSLSTHSLSGIDRRSISRASLTYFSTSSHVIGRG